MDKLLVILFITHKHTHTHVHAHTRTHTYTRARARAHTHTHTHLSSKLWYHLLTMELSILGNHLSSSNRTHEFIQYFADLIEPLYIFLFSLGNTYTFNPKRECN